MSGSGVKTARRTRVYVDGYNLYYGCLKNTPYKWLDLLTLFANSIIPSSAPADSELLPAGIKFFTAKIIEKAAKASDSLSTQERYHTALRKMYGDRIELIAGYYSMTRIKARIVDVEEPGKWPNRCQEVLVWKLEEKQTDVNLALRAYHDAITGAVDQVIIVTNDTDIAPALKMIRTHTQVMIGLVVPTTSQIRIPNTDLAQEAHWVRTHITSAELAASQLPRVIPGRKPTVKPESWYARPDLLETVLALATADLGSRSKAFKWVEAANPHLGNIAPIDLLNTDEDAARVINYIVQFRADQTAGWTVV